MRRRVLLCCLALLAGLGASAPRADAAEVCVPNNFDVVCDVIAGSITAGIAAASPGDTVFVNAGIYSEFVVVDKSIKLKSKFGRALTTIEPPTAVVTGILGTVKVNSGLTGVEIGGVGQGFTIEGVDNTAPGLESAALYFQGTHTNAQVRDNEIVAAGEAGLLMEGGVANTGMVIDGNTFSGKTFSGTTAEGFGFADQFTQPNRPRQLAVVAGNPSTNLTFTNNQLIGTAGACNSSGQEQGNTLATLDSDNAVITGNNFAGVTSRFATSLRARRPNTTISGNTFSSAGLFASCTTPVVPTATGHIFMNNIGSTANAVAAANTFDVGVYVNGLSANSTIAVSIDAVVSAVPSGTTVIAMPGVYDEQVSITTSNITLNAAGATLRPSSLVSDTTQGSPCSNGTGTAIVLVSGASGVVLNDLNVDASLINPMPARLIGIFYRNASGAINGGSVVEVRNKPLDGSQNGLGIYVQAKGPNVADVDITGVTVSGYQKNGVTFNGCGCALALDGVGTGSITDSIITGAGDTPVIAQNGVQVGFGGSNVTISGNTITGHRYTGNPLNGTATGVLLFSATNNLISDNDISDGNFGIVFQGGSFSLCAVGDATGNTAQCNRIEGHDQDVFEAGVASDTAANTVFSNAFASNTIGVDGSAITSGTLNAENNYWGAGDGPSGVGPGSGDPVTTGVDFAPFLTLAPACVECTSDAQCDDGLTCSGTETCNLGTNQCQAGTAVTCSGECLTGICLEPSGTCQLELDGTSCSGNPDTCSLSDFCTSGVCNEGGSGDGDGDGVCTADDNCPALSNPSQANTDGDGLGNACDSCPGDAANDVDGDGICAGTGFQAPKTGDGDNCPSASNPSQSDFDGDDIGDVCDGEEAALNVTRARAKRNTSGNPAKPNGLVKVSGDMIVNLPGGDSLASPMGFAARVVDGLTLDTDALASPPSWTAAQCVVKTVPVSGVIRTITCKSADKNSTLVIRAVNPVNPAVPQVYKFTITIRRVAINGPFDSPVTATLEQGAIDRVGTINDCQSNSAGLSCKEG